MLIFRYLAKEVLTTLVSLTTLLLLIFMSNQFVHYLNRAAGGQLPAVVLMKLMVIELPNLLVLLLPLGFYISLLLAYGRLYADSEMTVLKACGWGEMDLLKSSLWMASVLSVIVLVIMFWVSPYVASERARVLHAVGIKTLIQTIIPERFRVMPDGLSVLYVTAMDRQHTVAQDIFLARKQQKAGHWQWEIVWANKASLVSDLKSKSDFVVLKDGAQYQGIPGHADYQVAKFEQYKAILPNPTASIKGDLRTHSSAQLWPWNGDLAKAAELNWRLSVPIMVMVLTLLAVPLSRLNPRQGKFARLLPAIILYIIYADFLFVARDWVALGKTPAWLGMMWLHAIFIIVGILLLWRNRVNLS